MISWKGFVDSITSWLLLPSGKPPVSLPPPPPEEPPSPPPSPPPPEPVEPPPTIVVKKSGINYLTKDMLNRLWPNCERKQPGLINGVIATQDEVFTEYGFKSKLVVAHAMAQFSHEFGAGNEMEENLNYRAEALIKQWPKHFTREQAYAMEHHPQLIANQAYNGRMGNRIGSNDGWDFRGRGGSQLTGRDNYEALSKIVHLDLLTHPEYLSSPQYFLKCSVADFVMCGCLPYAEKDDIYHVTQRLNGGQIGADQRKVWLTKWKAALEI